ncbi:MAG: serine/threonine protein kinase [Candidatus Obscuribacterales bacterium]|nr:serine/threonine protein kinase [Candidatus Obscuribacterales bacterium]
MPDNNTSQLVGSLISDRYEVHKEIGRGIFGAVYAGFHRQLEKPIAIKVLFQQVEPDDTGFKRFHREAQAASVLSHANIVKIYDFGLSENGRPFIIMDKVDGENLKDILLREGRMEVPRALPIFLQVCDALSHLHENGFLHRDIKPDNIILHDTAFQKDYATLVDFGIAKKINEPKNRKLTMEGTVVGTPAYMSPEQVMGKKLDNRSDIYAFGVLMYVVLTSKLPISGGDAIETMTKQVTDQHIDISRACPGLKITKALEMIVNKSLNKLPSERQKSMKELHQQLTACL